MTGNIREEVRKARKNQVNIMILSMDHDKYNNAIDIVLSKEEDKASALTRANQIGKDLLMSLNSSKYKNIINKWVKTLLTGECNSTYGEIVTQELNKVTASGGKLYNPEYKVISIDDAVKSELPTIYAFYILLIQY